MIKHRIFYLPKMHFILSVFFMNSLVSAQTSEKKYWIFFNESRHHAVQKFSEADGFDISERSLFRRKLRQQDKYLFNAYDIPVNKTYIQKIREIGFVIQNESRWLNAVTVFADAAGIRKIECLDFVKKVLSVRAMENPKPYVAEQIFRPIVQAQKFAFDYGPSLTQNQLINIPDLHDLGLDGTGILVGVIDTGFDYLGRNVFSRLSIIDEYDFIHGDSITANQGNEPAYQHNHGTSVLSIIAGFQEGELIGPAFGADYLLAKTEWVPTETRIEEDSWVAAIEWMERLGVDVVSSSLGYTYFDDGFSYAYEDMDGQTCVTTRAAEIAAEKGVVVVNSAGNARQTDWHYIVSPADGHQVIAVGAVHSDGQLASFSSGGPTADGRIKPDVVAQGVSVYAVHPPNPHSSPYSYLSGTSAACPLVAGVCALMLQARPELTPQQVLTALRQTAERRNFPDNEYGWGLVNAWDAVFYHGMIFTHFSISTEAVNNQQRFDMKIFSEQGIHLSSVKINIFDKFNNFHTFLINHRHENDFFVYIPEYIDIVSSSFYLEAEDLQGQSHKAPFGAPDQLYSFSLTGENIILIPKEKPTTHALPQNYPNPFNESTIFSFTLGHDTHAELSIYTITGQLVKTIASGYFNQGTYHHIFNISSNKVSMKSGLYIIRLKAGDIIESRKMLLIR